MRGSVDERDVRAARNQAIFRSVNRRIVELAESFGDKAETLQIACECADASCAQFLEIGANAYEAVRASPSAFVVLPEHVRPDSEQVISTEAGYVVVVEISGVTGKVAETSHGPLDHVEAETTGATGRAAPSRPADSRPRLILFYSARSGECRRADGFLAQVLQRRGNHETFELVRVSVDERQDLGERFKVDVVPTLVVVEDKKVKGRMVSPTGCRDLEAFLRPWLR